MFLQDYLNYQQSSSACSYELEKQVEKQVENQLKPLQYPSTTPSKFSLEDLKTTIQETISQDKKQNIFNNASTKKDMENVSVASTIPGSMIIEEDDDLLEKTNSSNQNEVENPKE